MSVISLAERLKARRKKRSVTPKRRGVLRVYEGTTLVFEADTITDEQWCALRPMLKKVDNWLITKRLR